MGRKKKSKRGKEEIPNPSPSVVVYNGPTVPRPFKKEQDTITTLIPFTGTIASTAGGAIDSSYSNDPSTYASADWTNLAGLYHEYRALSLRVEFFPWNRYSKTTTVCTPMISVVDRGASGGLGSYAVAMNHGSAEKSSIEDPWVREGKMASVEEAAFLSTAGPTPYLWIKFYADGLSVSTTYGRFFVYLLVQARGRK